MLSVNRESDYLRLSIYQKSGCLILSISQESSYLVLSVYLESIQPSINNLYPLRIFREPMYTMLSLSRVHSWGLMKYL